MNNIAFIGNKSEEIMESMEFVLDKNELYTKHTVCIKAKSSDLKLGYVINCEEYDKLDIEKYDLFIFELEENMDNFDNIIKIVKKLLPKKDKKIIISALKTDILDKLNINYKFFKSMNKKDTIRAYIY